MPARGTAASAVSRRPLDAAGDATAPSARRPPPRWESAYRVAMFAVDATMILIAVGVSQLLRFGRFDVATHGVPYVVLSSLLVLVWLLMLAAGRTYEARFIGVGAEEFWRVLDACIRFFAVVAGISYVLKLELARGYVAIALPLGTVLLLSGRYAARKSLHRIRSRGRASYRVLAVGDRDAVGSMIREARRWPYAGMSFVGACVSGPGPLVVGENEVAVLGGPDDVIAALERADADAVAVAGGWSVGKTSLRQLTWELEGSGIDLLVAPSLTDVAGPRISVRPVAGLPLLHVEEPELTGGRRLVKAVFDRSCAGMLLVLLLPLLLAAAIAIKLDSSGPVFFRHQRVGQWGRLFTLWKLRTMHADADAARYELDALNEGDGALFKIRRDPRVTRTGRLLRRYSVDELPQLWNVVRGDMSLVGPRPPLPSEVATYETHVRRRLLVKPGMTGLWQVNGRSDLPWEESIRLDLHYVENWSIATDVLILVKTVGAVIRARGAY